MADRGKTIICSVLFLDISEYSWKSVSGQISLKERFNAYLSVAIRDVPIDDRIILDTGDGAALSFLGDVGDALQVALSMRESLREGLHMEPPLLVRMGINLGPVRLIRDINGQPNIVGDGINVAQRVMGFADPGQILVSRTYYDAVSRLSPEYAGMFHYQGSRTDKHVREHEIYAIGYPGEFTSTLTLTSEVARAKGDTSGISGRLNKFTVAFVKASPLRKLLYISSVFFPAVIVAAVLVVMLMDRAKPPVPTVPSEIAPVQAPPVVPTSAVTAQVPASAAASAAAAVEPDQSGKRTTKRRPQTSRHTTPQQSATPSPSLRRLLGGVEKGEAVLVLSCPEGATVYVDGQSKGKMGKQPMVTKVDAGRRLVLVMLSSRMLYNKSVKLTSGKKFTIGRDACH